MVPLLTITDAAREIGIGRRTVQRYLAQGLLRWRGEAGVIRKGAGIRIEELRKVHATSRRRHGSRNPRALHLIDYLPDLDADVDPEAMASEGRATSRDRLLTTLARLAGHIRLNDRTASEMLLEALRTLIGPKSPHHLLADRLLGKVEAEKLLHPALNWLAEELLGMLDEAEPLLDSRTEETRRRYEALILTSIRNNPPDYHFVLRTSDGHHYIDHCGWVQDQLLARGHYLSYPLSVYCRDASQGRLNHLGKKALPGESELIQAILDALDPPIEERISIDPIGLLRAARAMFPKNDPAHTWAGLTLPRFESLLHGIALATGTGGVFLRKCMVLEDDAGTSGREPGPLRPIPVSRLARYLGLPRRIVERTTTLCHGNADSTKTQRRRPV